MKKLFSLCALLSCLLFMTTSATSQVVLTATGGALAGSYTTVKQAFDSINSGYHQGAITISITLSTTETASCVLNSSGAGTYHCHRE